MWECCIRELTTNRWLPRGRRRLGTRSSLCACATGCGIISRVVLKEATTSEELFWSRLLSNASKGTFCSEYLLNLTLNPQIPSTYANRSFSETAFHFTECYSRHSCYLSNRKDVNLRIEWPKPFKRSVREYIKREIGVLRSIQMPREINCKETSLLHSKVLSFYPFIGYKSVLNSKQMFFQRSRVVTRCSTLRCEDSVRYTEKFCQLNTRV